MNRPVEFVRVADVEALARQLHALTRAMVEQARRDDWRAVGELETQRRERLEALFEHPDFDARLPQLADILNAVLGMSRECLMLGEQARQATTADLLRLHRGRRMSHAYLQVPS